MSRIPIRLRVAAAFAIAMTIVLAGSGWYVYTSLGRHLSHALNRELRVRADDLAAVVSDPDGSLAAATNGPFMERGESYAQLVARDGAVIQWTRPLGPAPVLSPADVRRALQGSIFGDRQRVRGLNEPSRFLAVPVTRGGGTPYVLVVGATLKNRAETLHSLRDQLLVAGPVALLVATVAGYLLAGLSLRPVDSMRRRAASISAERPGERLPVPHTRDEVERLGLTLNEMLGRLEDALARERSFVADAGHELRTPLALLRTELELALRHSGSADELREAIRRSSQEVDRMAQLAEDLLLLARSHGGELPLRIETLDAADLLTSVVSRFEWRAQAGNRPIATSQPDGLRLRGDRLRLEQALGNLVDNALRYGEGEVRVSAAQAGAMVELQVSDGGGGIPPEFCGRAFERFSRHDHARSRGGAGLGLAIVRAIAEAHGGVAGVDGDGRGADVWLTVPGAARAIDR
ncbi:MAG TPA: ATP-binding protein [Gaiellales bacterium]|nr:ATP-binding protein [Gaiellales bacterium]